MKKKLPLLICGILLLAGGLFFGVKAILASYAPRAGRTEALAPSQPPITASPTPAATLKPTASPTTEPSPTPSPEPTPEPTPTPEPYVSPVDFESLRELNPDIYAWLEIDGTDISYPMLQSATDDAYYLDHNSDKQYSANGAIFSEHAYNGTDMKDPVTILYGHHMKSGAMFGNLQSRFSDSKYFGEHRMFTVYTPEATLKYGIFAAIPFTGEHLLYYNDFSDEAVFEAFFTKVMKTRGLGALLDEEYAPKTGDRVVILSTCLIGNNTNRFLVMGTLLP